MSDAAHAARMVKELKSGGIDTSKIEVDDDQEDPAVEAGSIAEKQLLELMEGLLVDDASKAAPFAVKLMCLRGRKYEVERAAELLPNFLALCTEFGVDDEPGDQLKADALSGKMVMTGAVDPKGRPLFTLRLRNHKPKESKAIDMARLLSRVMVQALRKSVDAQRFGIVLLNDMSGVSVRNMDPAVPKLMFSSVFPRLPIRLARLCIFAPPFIIGRVVLPTVLFFMSKKLRARLTAINGRDFKALHEVYPAALLTADLGGTLAFDEAKFAKDVCGS